LFDPFNLHVHKGGHGTNPSTIFDLWNSGTDTECILGIVLKEVKRKISF
jgi:hypothetical protein